MAQVSPNQPSLARAWSVTLAGMGINLCLGVLYSWSVFAAALIDKLGWTKTQSQFPYTLACVVFALCMVPAGRMVDRYGPRLVATIGGILAGAGMFLSGATLTLAGITVGFGLLAGAAMGFGYSAPTPAAVKWFQPHKKGLIAGLVVAGYGLASVYIAPLTRYFLANYGIAKAFIYEGIIFLVAIIILAQVLAFPPAGFVPYGGPPPATRAAAAASSKHDFAPAEMLGTAQFYLLWLMFCFAASAGLMIIGHLAKIAQIQAGIQWGFVFVAILAVANAGGRVLAGWLSDRLGRTNTMLLVFAIQAANMLLFASYRDAVTLTIGSILTGIAYGANLSLFPSATFDFFGLKNAGINYGLVFTGWGAASLLGPIIAGRAADLTGGYNAAYLISAALLVVAAILSFITKPPVKAVPESETVKA